MKKQSKPRVSTLSTELRNKLERTIIQARDVAEAGAKAALEALAVHHYEPYGHMSIDERKLRNHLRARARQLGDKQNHKSELEITHLVWECAYEHWHRMLFARFLAENDLLIEPEMGVAISLEECEELAKEEGKDLWTLASEFAQRMLPQIFRKDDPILKVAFAREHRIKLESLLDGLEPSIFTASDSLGWVYQFWQSKRKKEVNQSGNKIGADELPAVTQLFTEPYMVSFLLDNSLGAWWAGRRLKDDGGRIKDEWKKCRTEADCRSLLTLPGVPLSYLRFVKVAEASSLCRDSGKMPLPQHEEICSDSGKMPLPQHEEICSDSGKMPLPQHEEICSDSGKMPLPQYKEIGYFHRDEPVSNLSGDLPHWRQKGVTYFVTFRTADSLPQKKLKQWQLEKEQWLHDHPEPHDEKSKKEFYEKFPERLQHWLDQGYGECVLAKQGSRKIVEGALHYFDGQRYDLDEFVIMPNHVHVLVTPKAGHELSEILHSWKSFTATKINKGIGKSGAFWQKESFDHIVRSPAQVERIRQYIRNHPAHSSRGFQPLENQAYGGRGFQPLDIQRQDAAATIWTPAAGTFDGWPDKLSELKVLDPCCGSGHFLVAAFQMLVPMRMELEGLSAHDAVDAVLRENIHGLELDQRCVELAAFALALAAWRYPDAGGYRPLPELNVACSGLAVNISKTEWKSIASVFPDKSYVPIALDWLYDEFQNAPVLGSLIDPSRVKVAGLVQWDTVIPALKEILGREKDTEIYETGVVAHGLAKAAQLLSSQYHWVITNVPYLARGKQVEALKAFCEKNYPAAKNDIATVFIERCLAFCEPHGVCSVVLPQNWLFLTTYRKFREKLLRNDTWHMVARLGPGAFETISGEVVKAILLILSRGFLEAANGRKGETGKHVTMELPFADSPSHPSSDSPRHICGVDVSVPHTAAEKAAGLLTSEITRMEQAKQLENPDARVVLKAANGFELLKKYASGLQGISPADFPHFGRFFWEVGTAEKEWLFWQSTIDDIKSFGGKELILWWNEDLKKAFQNGNAYLRGTDAWGKNGVVVRQMRNLPCAIYSGDRFDTNCAVIIPLNPTHLPAIWCFCSSPEYNEAVRCIDQKLNVTNATLVKVPFDLEYWQKVAAEKYPNGLPKPYSDDPTQWIFHGHPAKVAEASSLWNQRQDAATTLHVAIARLLGYRWPPELDAEMDLSDEQRDWVNKCDGLLRYVDKDGIVCIPSVRGEDPAADRLQEFLAVVYESSKGFQALEIQRQDAAATILPDRFQDWLNKLFDQAIPAGKTLDDWLHDHFFEQHCKLFHHRPFIWHIWDGRRRDGFHALVNYHKLAEGNGKGRQLLENLTYSYLGDWIIRQKDGVKQGEGGAEDRLAAALELQKRLIAIIEGEPPFDIFVRWKSIEKQPIGWEPDINDGVRLNIRPFMASDIPGGRKGAGVLRWKPNIKWNKDRGKDVASAPWFPLFKGDRINDHHLSLEEKRAAREEANRREGETGNVGNGEGVNGGRGETEKG